MVSLDLSPRHCDVVYGDRNSNAPTFLPEPSFPQFEIKFSDSQVNVGSFIHSMPVAMYRGRTVRRHSPSSLGVQRLARGENTAQQGQNTLAAPAVESEVKAGLTLP